MQSGSITTGWKNAEAGVVQGSVLGPILFIIYITGINLYLPVGTNAEKYADDIISYVIGNETKTDLPQQIVHSVELWCQDNHMRLNASKCEIIHFPATQRDAKPVIKIGNTVLEVVKSYKYLGIAINEKLDFEQQWREIASQTTKNVYL